MTTHPVKLEEIERLRYEQAQLKAGLSSAKSRKDFSVVETIREDLARIRQKIAKLSK